MRKLVAAEVLVISAMLLASDSTSADEFTNLPTVSVTGTYNTQTNYAFGGGYINLTSAPSSIGNWSGYISQSNLHALKCADAYMPRIAGNKGSKPGVSTYIVSNYIFKSDTTSQYYSSYPSSTPPATGGPWTPVSGYIHAGTIIMVSLPHNATHASLINTIAHEWAHAWGANETEAAEAGDDAEAAYLRDRGAKCGGLR